MLIKILIDYLSFGINVTNLCLKNIFTSKKCIMTTNLTSLSLT